MLCCISDFCVISSSQEMSEKQGFNPKWMCFCKPLGPSQWYNKQQIGGDIDEQYRSTRSDTLHIISSKLPFLSFSITIVIHEDKHNARYWKLTHSTSQRGRDLTENFTIVVVSGGFVKWEVEEKRWLSFCLVETGHDIIAWIQRFTLQKS